MDFSAKYLIHILVEHGFELKRSKGSHFIYYHAENKITVPVPINRKDIKKGTFYSILREAKIDKSKLM